MERDPTEGCSKNSRKYCPSCPPIGAGRGRMERRGCRAAAVLENDECWLASGHTLGSFVGHLGGIEPRGGGWRQTGSYLRVAGLG